MTGNFDRLKAFLGRPIEPVKAAPLPEPRQAPLLTPSPLATYAKPMAQSTGAACPRCLTVSLHWITRVYADAMEVRLCRPCWAAWDARQKARAA